MSNITSTNFFQATEFPSQTGFIAQKARLTHAWCAAHEGAEKDFVSSEPSSGSEVVPKRLPALSPLIVTSLSCKPGQEPHFWFAAKRITRLIH